MNSSSRKQVLAKVTTTIYHHILIESQHEIKFCQSVHIAVIGINYSVRFRCELHRKIFPWSYQYTVQNVCHTKNFGL